MNMLQLMNIAQNLIAEGENSELVTDIKNIVIKIINDEHNCGYDRAELTTQNIVYKIVELIKGKGLI